MNLNMISNMNTHLQTLKLKTQWDMKQKTGEYLEKGKSLDEWLGETSALNDTDDAQGADTDETLKGIQWKLQSGGKLTPDEKRYLKENDPQTYNKLVAEEQEQKAYEQALRRCKTQEEVERLRLGRVNASLVAVRSVENNPNIPKHKKLEIIAQEKRRLDNVIESTQKFVRSGEYAKLPTRAEEAIAREEEAMQRDPAPKPETEQSAARPEEPDRVQQETEAADSAKPEKPAQTAAEKPDDDRAEKEFELDSPERRKVRRAKIRAAYAAVQGSTVQGGSRFNRKI